MKKLTENDITQKSLFTSLLDLVLGRSGDEKYGKLKTMNRTLSREGYSYYSFRRGKLTPQFAKAMYTLYETVAPMREFFLKNNDNEYYKNRVLDYAQTESQLNIAERLSPTAIKLAASQTSIKAAADTGQKLFAEFRAGFSAGEGMRVNQTYQTLLILKQFCVLDYYACLKRFCPEMEENTFGRKYKFVSVSRGYVADFIIDFLNDTFMLLEIEDFGPVSSFLKTMDGWDQTWLTELLNRLEQLRKMQDRKLLTLFGAVISQDPDFAGKSAPEARDIVRPYIEEVYQMFRSTVQDLIHEKKLSQFNEYLDAVFSYQDLKKLRHYNSDESQKYEERGAGGFLYCNAAMYVQAFIKKYGHGELENFCGVFRVAAHSFIPDFIQDFAARCQDLYDAGNSLFSFDQHLDTDFSEGYKLKNLLDNSRSNDKIVFKLSSAINDINVQADEIIKAAVSASTDIAKTLESMKEDRTDKKNIISNWPQVEKQLGKPVAEVLDPMVSHFRNFVNLMSEYKNL